uniref:Uncharacterized protein n=1 Tax=Clytia hemisphaerica TaxID=252671 RepID=A0A7M5XBM6_9CNID
MDSSARKTISMAKYLQEALDFEEQIMKATIWVKNNNIKAILPRYVTMNQEEKDRIRYLHMKAATSDVTERETCEMNTAVEFLLETREAHIHFASEMHRLNLSGVSSRQIE